MKKFFFVVLTSFLFLLFFIDSLAEEAIMQEAKKPRIVKSDRFVVHRVKKGETLWKISRMYGDKVLKIKKRNKLSGGIIYPSQKLKIHPRPRKAIASWYGEKFHGKKMANGKIFRKENPHLAAHKYLPLGSEVLIKIGDKENKVIISDRGPFIKGRDLDCSEACAERLGYKNQGIAEIEYKVLSTPYN
jgi:rare lipoprotein A